MARMRTLFTFVVLLASVFASAQTFFYIGSIDVVPASPTVSDQIEIHVHGDLSSTAAFIQDVQYMIEGNTVHITITAATSGIGLDVLVPHTEIVEIGTLPAGDYVIHFMGANILDSAPQPEHEFTVSGGGGTDCDSLQIVSIMYEAFGDSLIEVHLTNAGSEIFSYPGLILFNADGDTIAVEEVNSFGIGTTSIHLLSIHPDADLTDPEFSGTLELWTNFYDTLACTFPVEVQLCPPGECATIVPYAANLGGALVNDTFNYSILNDEGEAVATGTITLTDSVQFNTDTICIPPGDYTVEVFLTGPGTGGGPYFGVAAPGHSSGPQVPVTSPGVPLEFTFYDECSNIPQVIGPIENEAGIRFTQHAGHILIEEINGTPLRSIELIAPDGKIILIRSPSGAHYRIGTADLGAGLYLVRVIDAEGLIAVQKFTFLR